MLTPAITDLEQLKEHPAVARLRSWNALRLREQSSIATNSASTWSGLRCAKRALCCGTMPTAHSTYLSDVTCVDWHPAGAAL